MTAVLSLILAGGFVLLALLIGRGWLLPWLNERLIVARGPSRIGVHRPASALGGLDMKPTLSWQRGTSHGFPWKASVESATEDHPARLQLVMEAGLRMPPWLRVEDRRRCERPQPKLGDAALDLVVNLHGERDWLHATLSEQLRAELVSTVTERSLLISDRLLRCEFSPRGGSSDAVSRCAEQAATLLDCLCIRSEDIPRLLAERARTDRLARIRSRAALQLLARHADSPEAQALATEPALLGSSELRFLAASAQGSSGTRLLADQIQRESEPRKWKIAALRRWLEIAPPEQRANFLAGLLTSKDAIFLSEVLRGAAKQRVSALLPALTSLALRPRLPSHPADDALARAIVRLGDPSVEPALLRFLRQDDAMLVGIAIRGLGRHGSLSAIEPLLPFTEGLLRDVDHKRWAKDAVTRIQGRLSGVAGALSLVEDGEEDGWLDYADDGAEVGCLDFSPEPGALSEA